MRIIIILCILVPSYVLGNFLTCPVKWPSCGLTVKNIVCERDEKCLAEEGCEDVQSDAEFLKWILHEHNRLRNEIATGKKSRGFTGPAANMMALSYDKDLEFTAACNANRCKYEHDKCRGTQKFRNAGQNLFHATGNSAELRGAVSAWFEEIKLSTPDVIDKFPGGRDEISNFAQMIWAETTHIGCARSKKTDSDDYYLVCNYGPGGNKENNKVYKRGAGCSKCPLFVKCNEQYPALCGKIDQNTLGEGTGSSGVIPVKEEPIEEKAQDKVEAAAPAEAVEGGKPDAPAVPGISSGGFGGIGAGGGLGLGEQAKEQKNEDNNNIKTTQNEDFSKTSTITDTSDNEVTTKVVSESSKASVVTNSTEVTTPTPSPITIQQSTTLANNATTLANNTTKLVNITTLVNATKNILKEKLNKIDKPDSAHINMSSRMFIASLISMLLGYWYCI